MFDVIISTTMANDRGWPFISSERQASNQNLLKSDLKAAFRVFTGESGAEGICGKLGTLLASPTGFEPVSPA
jgi:hypothetical protein